MRKESKARRRNHMSLARSVVVCHGEVVMRRFGITRGQIQYARRETATGRQRLVSHCPMIQRASWIMSHVMTLLRTKTMNLGGADLAVGHPSLPLITAVVLWIVQHGVARVPMKCKNLRRDDRAEVEHPSPPLGKAAAS